MRYLALLLLVCANAFAAPAFAPVVPGHALSFPHDYGAHPGFKTEWWYATGWLTTAEGKPLGFQVTFFRSATGVGADNPSAFAPRQIIVGHAALSDPATGKLVHVQRNARAALGLAFAKEGDTDLKLDAWTFQRAADGSYQAHISTPELSMDLRLAPQQALLLQGEQGFSQKGPQAANASYYYSEPQLRVSGSVQRGAQTQLVTGSAWLDHEWSSEALDPAAAGWDWVGANLADGSALMAFQIRAKQGGKLWARASLRDAQGRVSQYGPEQVSFTPQAQWTSPRTRASYPVSTLVKAGQQQWLLVPLQQDQELDARRTTGAVYWEGAVTLTRDGQAIGHGYLEMTGYQRHMKL